MLGFLIRPVLPQEGAFGDALHPAGGVLHRFLRRLLGAGALRGRRGGGLGRTLTPDVLLMHRCDIPICVHATPGPDSHLAIGSMAANMRDREQ